MLGLFLTMALAADPQITKAQIIRQCIKTNQWYDKDDEFIVMAEYEKYRKKLKGCEKARLSGFDVECKYAKQDFEHYKITAGDSMRVSCMQYHMKKNGINL